MMKTYYNNIIVVGSKAIHIMCVPCAEQSLSFASSERFFGFLVNKIFVYYFKVRGKTRTILLAPPSNFETFVATLRSKKEAQIFF
jgi:hypothetical protein